MLSDLYYSKLPLELRLKILALRRLKTINNSKIIFIHVPKNAGTSLVTQLYGGFIGHYRAKDLYFFQPNIFSDYPSFAIIRDPVDRAWSAFKFALHGSSNSGGARISAQCNHAIKNFTDFDFFVNKWLAYQDLSTLDHVFRPQIDYISLNDGSIPCDLITFESLPHSSDKLFSFGIQNLPRLNQSLGRKGIQISNETRSTIKKIYTIDHNLYLSLVN